MISNGIDRRGCLEESFRCHNCGDGFTVVYAKEDWDYLYNRKKKARADPGFMSAKIRRKKI